MSNDFSVFLLKGIAMSSPETKAALEQSFEFFTRDSDVVMMLMEVEDTLRAGGKKDVADRLDKMQRDITGWYAYADTATPLEGEQTKTFVDGYEDITPARLNRLVYDIGTALPAGPLKKQFGEFTLAVLVPEEAPAPNMPLKALFALAECSDILDRVQKDLVDNHRGGYAKVLSKLQQDVGTMVARAVGAEEGAKSARKDFALVTTSRATAILQETYAVASREMQYELSAVLQKVDIPPPSAAQMKRSNLRR